MAAPALEKLRMHWTSHMDQYNIQSHPQFESPLPYLISSQLRKDPLPLLRPRPRHGSHSLLRAMSTTTLPPLGRSLPKNLWSNKASPYGKDPSWRSEQISFLHSEQLRHTNAGQALPGPSMRPLPRYGMNPYSHSPVQMPGPIPLEAMNARRSTSPTPPAIPLRRPASYDDRPGSNTPPKYNVNGTADMKMDINTVMRTIPRELHRFFALPDTKDQPHLNELRTRKRNLQQRIDNGDPDALAELREFRAAKRRSNPNGLLSEQEKKANHIASEQKRRANIRKGYDMLSNALPKLRNRGTDNKDEEPMDAENKSGVLSELAVLEEAIVVLEERLEEHRELLARKAELQTRILQSYGVTR
ncbi:hypothetical protein CBS9595_000614 [Malassezia furfur]|nr:hypothetical protein CBS9595_000614 [Malassezia furfur]